MSSLTPPMGFQQDAINSATGVLSSCLTELVKVRGTAQEASSKQLIIAHRGALLFEAPTGTGKTLMAGNTVERLSLSHKVIWFWFAPFAGVIEQTSKSIRQEFKNLRVKDPSADRDITTLASGDVFVTTWASVAVVNTESRKIRKDSELQLSLDEMIVQARVLGFHIGVVVDESHHSFRGQSQASSFYQDILSPDITILATATPKDKDIEDFVTRNNIKHLNRISVSRKKAVEAGLIKKGVKVAVFKAPQAGVEELVNFRQTALKYAVRAHKQIKTLLEETGQSITPLLLVQAESQDNIKVVEQWLYDMGFTSGQVRSHSSKEPDPHLLTIAADESVEVLVFVMAVATGFDVPRAWTLVSLRTSRDADFGTQIVGRIMRVDRRLQNVVDVPESLQNAYVFLADNEAQAGLNTAAQRINAIEDELAIVSDNVAVFTIGEETAATITDKHGQLPLIAPAGTNTDGNPANDNHPDESSNNSSATAGEQQALFVLGLVPNSPTSKGSAKTTGKNPSPSPSPPQSNIFRYSLRDDIAFPRQFRKAVISVEQSNLLAEVVSLFRFDDGLINVARQSAAKIIMEQTEIFGQTTEVPEEVLATLAQDEIDKHAQLTLDFANKDGMINIRDLFLALENQLGREFRDRGWDDMEAPGALRKAMNKILALRPAMLRDAVIEATKRHITVADAAHLPEEIITSSALQPSRLNVYKACPDDLNSWELAFVQELDRDTTGTVLWWHRNPPRKPYSVGIPLPGQSQQSYYWPDFIVGVNNRSRGNGILLVETKRVLNDEEGNAHAKSKVEHPEYKKPMMLYWENEARWMVVEYDPAQDKNVLERVWKASLMVGW